LTIPDGITAIKNYAFYGCAGLNSLTLPNSVTSIGYKAFSGCTGLTTAKLSDNITTIDYRAFSGCSSLISISIPNPITEISLATFEDCVNLTSVEFGENLKTIDTKAFYNCAMLSKMSLPNSLTTIKDSAFFGCSSLSGMLTIPPSITSIPGGAFRGTSYEVCEITGETLIEVPDDAYHPEHEYGNYYTFSKESFGQTETIIVPGTMASDYRDSKWGELFDVVSNTGTEVSVNVTTPGNLAKDIVSQARKAPASVNKLTITGGQLNEADFNVIKSNMTACFDVDMSAADCETIPDNALSDKAVLRSIVLPDNATNIGNNAFANCPCLETVSVTDNSSLQTVGDEAFSNCKTLKTAKLGNKVTTIGDKAFYGTYNLINFNMPANLATLGNSAFYGCLSLTDAIIPDAVTTIEDSTFHGCISLSNVTLPANITAIGDNAFSGCSALSSISIPETVTSIGNSAFANSALTHIDLSALYLTAIGTSVFNNCSRLQDVAFPQNITSIEGDAFNGCSSLTELNLAETAVTTIGDNAFNDCTNLTTVSLPATTTKLGGYAFGGCRKVQTISITAMTPPTAKATTFKNVANEVCTLVIPTDAFYDYLLAQYWGSFVDIKSSFDITMDGDGVELDYEIFDSEDEARQDLTADGNSLSTRSNNRPSAKAATNRLADGISLFVNAAKTVRFRIVENSDIANVQVILNDEDISNNVVNGYLIVSNFNEVNTLKIKAQKSGQADGITNVTVGNDITDDTIVDVYNLAGMQIMHGVEMGSINGLNTGVYLIRSANAVKKIVIR
jgi:hypothetical protein